MHDKRKDHNKIIELIEEKMTDLKLDLTEREIELHLLDTTSKIYRLTEKLDQYKFKLFQQDQDIERVNLFLLHLNNKLIIYCHEDDDYIPKGFMTPEPFEMPDLS